VSERHVIVTHTNLRSCSQILELWK
jgi:hypothetical protein